MSDPSEKIVSLVVHLKKKSMNRKLKKRLNNYSIIAVKAI